MEHRHRLPRMRHPEVEPHEEGDGEAAGTERGEEVERRVAVRRASGDVGHGELRELDRFLSDRLELSRTRVQKLLEAGEVRVITPEGPMEPRKAEPLALGWRIELVIPEPEEPLELVQETIA